MEGGLCEGGPVWWRVCGEEGLRGVGPVCCRDCGEEGLCGGGLWGGRPVLMSNGVKDDLCEGVCT